MDKLWTRVTKWWRPGSKRLTTKLKWHKKRGYECQIRPSNRSKRVALFALVEAPHDLEKQ